MTAPTIAERLAALEKRMRAGSHPTNAHLGAGVFNHTFLEWADELAVIRAEVEIIEQHFAAQREASVK